MLKVRNRKRLAAAALVVFIAVSGTFLFIAARDYRPSELSRRAEEAFEKALPCEIELGAAEVSFGGEAVFDEAKVFSGGRRLLYAGRVSVAGLPAALGRWRPRSIDMSQVTACLDLSGPSAPLDAVKTLSEIAAARGDMEVSLPDNLAVVVKCPEGGEFRYMASSGKFLEQSRLELRPIGEDSDSPARLVVTPDRLRLDAGTEEHSDGLSHWVSKRVASALGIDSEAAQSGSIELLWERKGESIRVSYAPRGLKILDSAETFEIDVGEGALAVVLEEALIRDGALAEAGGSVEYRAPRVSRERLARWLALVSMSGLTGSDAPQEFENVRIAARFDLRDGCLEIEPEEDAPGLVYSEVDGEEIVLFSGSGRASFADFRAGVDSLKDRTPEAEADLEPDASVESRQGE